MDREDFVKELETRLKDILPSRNFEDIIESLSSNHYDCVIYTNEPKDFKELILIKDEIVTNLKNNRTEHYYEKIDVKYDRYFSLYPGERKIVKEVNKRSAMSQETINYGRFDKESVYVVIITSLKEGEKYPIYLSSKLVIYIPAFP